MRCLKRYVARQVFEALPDTLLDEAERRLRTDVVVGHVVVELVGCGADRDDVRQVVREATLAEGVLT